MLQVKNLETGYGKKKVIHRISLEVKKGEIVALIGHNGAGKSTILKSIFGLLDVWKGKIIFNDNDITNRKSIYNVKEGMVFAPQGNRIFSELSVKENLEMGGYTLNNKSLLMQRINFIFELFPSLENRKFQVAGTLSGGEKQMLALGNALVLNPDLLLLDEPSLGLSPKYAKLALKRIKEINEKFQTTILIVEQKVRDVLEISDRVYVLKIGKISYEAISSDLLSEDKIKKIFL